MERTFLRRLESLEGMFTFIEEFLDAEGLDRKHATNIGLVAEELFTNIVRHSRGGSEEVGVKLTRRGPEALLSLTETDVELWDPTKSAPPVDPNATLEKRRPGGLGIHFVRKLAKDFSYEHQDRTSTVTVVLSVEDADV